MYLAMKTVALTAKLENFKNKIKHPLLNAMTVRKDICKRKAVNRFVLMLDGRNRSIAMIHNI